MPEDVRNQALDVVMAIIAVAALVIGLGSVALGKIVFWWDSWRGRSVNNSLPVMSPDPAQMIRTDADGRTDGRASGAVSAQQQRPTKTALDRTRKAVIEQLLTDGWSITDMRREGILRGENTVVGQEVAEARERLGMPPAGEYRTPIAGRPTAAVFETGELTYEPPPPK